MNMIIRSTIRRFPWRQGQGKLVPVKQFSVRNMAYLIAFQSPSALLFVPAHVQTDSFTANNAGRRASFTTASSKSGVIASIRGALRTIFRKEDDTPKGIQERKDTYWIVLALAHRKLRIEHQSKLGKSSDTLRVDWREESNEQVKDLMEEAVSHLDDHTDIGGMSLRRLRSEVQSLLEPQVVNMLTAAHDVEEYAKSCHGIHDDEEENYEFSAKEAEEYREILLREYDYVCQSLKDRVAMEDGANNRQERTSNPIPFYETKKSAIELLLTYFDWWPNDSSANSAEVGEVNHMDEFGFCADKSDPEILPAMRYYHVRNLVRSSLVRNLHGNHSYGDDGNGVTQQHQCFNSLLALKSTVPNAGRGVFVDGFAPAGSLLAFIPGKVWPKDQLRTASLQAQVQLSANDHRHHLSIRYDDILIDSRQSPYTVVKNLWAVGHIMNHPPAPMASTEAVQTSSDGESDAANDDDAHRHHQFHGPNCVTVPINFTTQMFQDTPEGLQDYIPNEYELPPKNWAKSIFDDNDREDVIVHGMGLVALRDVKDEELFYDYRLSPDKEKQKAGGGISCYPSWYHVWDKEAMSNRWDIGDS
ncbi:hypothetical protein ACHAWF_006051 [Thalassiosira exigua]